ncbi:hypothetical protein B0I32_1402 [Nonomuraea fuscirosea]|uniref:Uncharacterized protein n=1 Tax=Nonomuraea fuscirosea TaxID=1291556 RepID=A0A2T0LXN2_9ACTN|nr:hypothetical protein [Nonomuraea fuscirosea]PRX48757.1 hypothetical protein B0I32_1402 [Nonomuraea fuscirosea]
MLSASTLTCGSSVTIRSVAATPSMTGMCRSISTTSGCRRGFAYRVVAVAHLPHLQAGIGLQQHCATHYLVVNEQYF